LRITKGDIMGKMSDTNPETRQSLPDIPEVILASEVSQPTNWVMTSEDSVNGNVVRERARRLHTDIYLAKGYIDESDLDEKGLFTDRYTPRAVYMYAENQNRETACRYITGDKKQGGLLSLPTPLHFAIDADVVRRVSGERSLRNLNPSKVIEVSGLVSLEKEGSGSLRGELNATRLAYARILRDSLDKGHQLWFLNTHKELVRSLQILVGEKQVNVLGDMMDYMKSPTVPVAMNPQQIVLATLNDESKSGEEKRSYLNATLQGVSERYLSKELKDALHEHGIATTHATRVERLKQFSRDHYIATLSLGMVAYAAARAFPIGGVAGVFGASPWTPYVFGGLDIATSPSYVWGLAKSITGETQKKRAFAGGVAITSFVLPYAYLATEGQEFPVWMDGAAGLLIAGLATNSVAQYIKEKRLQAALETSVPETEA
jgi:hypothetical protein